MSTQRRDRRRKPPAQDPEQGGLAGIEATQEPANEEPEDETQAGSGGETAKVEVTGDPRQDASMEETQDRGGDAASANANAGAAAAEEPQETEDGGENPPQREEEARMAEERTTTEEEQGHGAHGEHDNGGHDSGDEGHETAIAVGPEPLADLREIARSMPPGPEKPTGFVMLDSPAAEISELMEAIHENTGGEGLSVKLLERVTVPSGGGVQWRREDSEGVHRYDSIEGIILHTSTHRAYWPSSLEEDGIQPPECHSNDGKTGSKYGNCGTCQFAQFGSGGGDRQACKKSMNLFVLEEDRMMPTVIQVPLMSIGAINAAEMEGQRYRKSYFTTDLLDPKVMRPFHKVVTSFHLEEATNSDNIMYSVIRPSLSSTVDREAWPRIDAIRAATRTLVEQETVLVATGQDDGGGDGNPTVVDTEGNVVVGGEDEEPFGNG